MAAVSGFNESNRPIILQKISAGACLENKQWFLLICKRGSSCTVFVALKLGKLTFIDTSNGLKIKKR